ncbi:MAG: hypothetical protein L3K17_06155, partial [Thermoplasmata archaeon]|nr:hypothetical protein [Thermoplasmata archaeon]
VVGEPQIVNVSWHQSLYAVWVRESGLPTGEPWSVTLGSTAYHTNANVLIEQEPNGSIPFSVGNVPGWHADEYSGSLEIRSAAVEITINWTRTVYPVIVSEIGLPSGQRWSIVLDGTSYLQSSSSIVFGELPNGTLPYEVGFVDGWRAGIYHGNFTVDGGPANFTVVWSQVTYRTQIEEIGLPSGTPWAISAYGETIRSTGSFDNWTTPNGTYEFNVSNVPGWRANVYRFSVQVQDQPVFTTVVWQRVVYSVTVSATGLPPGHPWSSTFDGTQLQALGPTVTFPSVPNGSYPLTASASGYASIPASVEVRVNGSAVSMGVHFSATHSGIPESFLWIGIGIGVVAVLGVGAVAFSVRARRRASRGGASDPRAPLLPPR